MTYPQIRTNDNESTPAIDACSSALVQRPDDTESVIRERLRVYAEQTQPIAERYRERELLREVDARGTPEEIAGRLTEALSRS